MTEAELRIHRQELVRRQMAIAERLNAIPPAVTPPGFSKATEALITTLHEEAEQNALAIRAIDFELGSVS